MPPLVVVEYDILKDDNTPIGRVFKCGNMWTWRLFSGHMDDMHYATPERAQEKAMKAFKEINGGG